MSYLNTKQALVSQLINAGLDAPIAFENKNFDPSNYSKWLACYFLPVSSFTTGKTLESSDEQRGIFQVSVMVRHNSQNYDNEQLALIDEIVSNFNDTTSISYNGQIVDILETTVNNGRSNESWFQRDISINYLTFSARV